MSKTVTIDGKQYTVPDDATLEEIEAFIAASSPQLHGPELAAQREAEALQARAASFAPAGDPLAKPGAMARKPDLFDAAMAGQIPAEQPKSLQQDIADRLGAGADFLMAPLNARNTGGDDPTNAIARMAVEPLARLPEALVRDPLKTIAQDYNPIYQAGMGYKDVESAAGKAMQGDFAGAGMQGLEGATQIMGGALGMMGVKGGPKAPGTATSLAQAERQAVNTRAAFPAETPAAPVEPPKPAAPMTYEEVAALVRKAARGGMGSKQAEEALARAAPLNKDAAAAAERLGIDVPPDVLLDHTQLKEAIGLTRSMPGTLASAAWTDAVERAATKADEAMAMIDGSPDLSEVSDTVLKSMQDTQRALQAQSDDMYKLINARIGGEKPAATSAPSSVTPLKPGPAERAERQVFDAPKVSRSIMDPKASSGTTEIIRNPSQADLLRLSKGNNSSVRYFKDDAGNVYVANAYDTTHDAMLKATGQKKSAEMGQLVRTPDNKFDVKVGDGNTLEENLVVFPMTGQWLRGETPLKPAPKPTQGAADTFKRDPAMAGLSPSDMVAYIEAKYPRAGNSISSPSPYWDAATAIKRANGDRAAAAAQLQQYADYLKKTKSAPEMIDTAERTVRAVADVDPIWFDDAAFTESMAGKAEAGAAAAFEQAGLEFPPASKPAAPKPPTVDLVNSRRLMDSVTRELGGDTSKLSSLEKELADMASPGRKTPVTYAALMRMKSDVGQALEKASGPYKDVNSGILKRLYGALAEDQLLNVERIGGKQLRDDLRLANQLTAKRKALEDRIVSLFGDERNGSIAQKLVATVKSGAKGDVTGFNRIVRQLPPELRKKAVATAIAAAARETKTNGFGFAKYVDLYQGLRRNSEVYKTVVETLGPDSDKFLNDLYKISKRITEARANVKTTGQANQALVQGMMAEGLVQQVMGSTFGRMATTGAATTVAGASGGTLAGASTAMLVNALSRTSKKGINAAGDLFASPEWQQLVAKVAAEDRVDKRAFNAARTSKAFREWTKTAGITDPDAWLRNALAVSIGTGIANSNEDQPYMADQPYETQATE